ncbi:MAG: pyruvate kinase [Gammaproteobacteria bacterium]
MNQDSAPPAAPDPSPPADTSRESLRRQLIELHAEVIAQAAQRLEQFRACYPGGAYSASARNLAHYLALRRFDLRPLQDALAEIGISSLGRCEAHVLPTLNQVIGLLGGAVPADTVADIPPGPQAGQALLAEHTRLMFGAGAARRYTRIMVTLPAEGAEDYALIRELLAGGMNCARINCAHDGPEVWERLAHNVRRAQAETGIECRILMDLAGTKLRTGPVEQIPAVVHLRTRRDRYGRTLAPAAVLLCADGSGIPADAAGHYRFSIAPDLYADLRDGDRLVFRDTRGKPRAINVLPRDEAGCWRGECWDNAYLSDETVLQLERADDGLDYRRIGGPHRFTRHPSEDVEIRLRTDDRLLLSTASAPGRPAAPGARGPEPAAIGCSHPQVLTRLAPGQPVWFDDGKIGGVVEAVDAGGALVRITHARPTGARLRADKGINFPGADLGLSGLTAEDRACLDSVCRLADMVGFSFVETLDDMEELIGELTRRGALQLGIIAKIETRRAVMNLPELILGTIGRFPFGVMIARGDLAVELGGERMSEIQEEILWLCEAAHTPAIWATQVLETLTQKGAMNRAEFTDAAMSARAECVMLNKGLYVLQSVRTLDDILARLQQHQYKKFSRYRALHW